MLSLHRISTEKTCYGCMRCDAAAASADPHIHPPTPPATLLAPALHIAPAFTSFDSQFHCLTEATSGTAPGSIRRQAVGSTSSSLLQSYLLPVPSQHPSTPSAPAPYARPASPLLPYVYAHGAVYHPPSLA